MSEREGEREGGAGGASHGTSCVRIVVRRACSHKVVESVRVRV